MYHVYIVPELLEVTLSTLFYELSHIVNKGVD